MASRVPGREADVEVYGLAFDPVADRLAVGGYGDTAYLFDVSDLGRPAKVGELYLHLAPVVALEFAPDGQFLVAGDRGGSALVERLARSSGAEAGVGAIAFARDGERLVGVVYTEPGVVWDLDLDRVQARICERAGVGITESEWRQFVPDLSYDPPCD
ncbi:hypothetical protein CC117_28520 [Parafrankia colletiae]|uniref:WD40 repeat domain-containing protein n=1 Tax=Parafrankia colletiae TaxID=573497 RepID=A0A1S1Q8F0_9ACTN|nr:hypothetical protein [Parafrankia colletiae]MCK9901900.1 hypothetical protein [Frankia sp. Cpl3]OHV29761.1 hypothetical protein CC117_28520 [Parafrankia colletiae]